MIVGTSHFVSAVDAYRYYRDYGIQRMDEIYSLERMGAIHIGAPAVKKGQTLIVIDNGARYAIVSQE